MTSIRRTSGRSLLAAICFSASACTAPDAPAPAPQRQTLPDGRVLLSYPSLPATEDTVVADLRIGSLMAGGPDTFAELRGIDVAADGTLYILEAQTSEIRTFAADGSYLASLSRRGQGPGEISRGNGLALGPDGTLWINDYGSRGLIHLSAEGSELGRYPGLVPGFGYLWSGAVDGNGLIWERWTHPVEEPSFDITATGPIETTSRMYFKSFDPRTSAYDSVFVGVVRGGRFRVAHAGGQTVMGIPFSAEPLAVIDRSGHVWAGMSDDYVLTRIGPAGDTILVLSVAIPPSPVTSEDLEAWRESMTTTFERVPIVVRGDVEALIPEHKAILARLVTDDENRLWVGRSVGPDDAPLYDVFDPGGAYLGSVRLFQNTYSPLPPVIRQGRVYALVLGDFEEQYVVAGPVPDFPSR